MDEKRVTSQDVADLAGVSRTTVSFVLNQNPRFTISAETQHKVLSAAESLGYVPNASARALASKKTKAIGLIITRDPKYVVSDVFLPQIIGGLLDFVRNYGLSLMIEWVEPGQQLELYRKLTRAKHIDGMILTVTRYDDSGLKAIEDSGIPAVLMGTIPGSSLHSVDMDNIASARKAVEHLLGLGHRQIACITDAVLPYASSSQRLEGYKEALEEAGLPYQEALVRYGDFDAQSGYTAMRSLLKEPAKPSAVFAASDNVAFGAMAAVRQAGLRIPQDIAFVGHDDIPLARFAQPPLTTVRVPADEIARRSGQVLMDLLSNRQPYLRNLVLDTELIVRSSSTPPKGAHSEV